MRKILTVALALLLLMGCAAAAEEGSVQLNLSADIAEGYGGDVVTLSLSLTAENLGGLQTTVGWNEGYLTYIEDSAAFAEDFTADAEMGIINDAAEGSIRLVYGNTSGYTAENECVFTAQFRLNDDTAGYTVFELSDTKATDASAELNAMTVEASEAGVQTLLYDAGNVYLTLCSDTSEMYVGDVVTIILDMSADGSDVGSLQGTIHFDPTMLEYVADSAAFSDAAVDAAFTQIINDDAEGQLSFVYGSLTGCPQGTLMTAQFEIISDWNEYGYMWLSDAKATNAETDRLSMMNCWAYDMSFCIQRRPDVLYYTTRIDETGIYNGDTAALKISADGVTMGGLQATVCYNPDQLEYVADSAAFADAFADCAAISMINDSVAGEIKLIYSSTDGYSPDGEDIFAAEFTVKTCEVDIDPITVSDIKTTNASSDSLQEIPSYFVQGIDWQQVLMGHKSVTDAAVAATCTETGLTEGAHCSICSDVLTAQTETPALGHTDAIDAAVAATCTEAGLTEGTHCSVCGDVLTVQTVVPALGHTDATDAAVAATCTKTGLTEGTHCSVCGDVLTAQTVVPALGHTDAEAVTENNVDPTCTADGSYDAVVYCSVCGVEVLRENTVVPALGHTDVEAVTENNVDPTCTEDGSYDAVVYCSVCGVEVSRENTVVPALGHTDAEAVTENNVDPTCTADGSYNAVVYCSVCGVEVSRENTVVPAPGHTEVIDEAVEPTCTEAGLTEGMHCEACGEILALQEVLGATGHKVSLSETMVYADVDGMIRMEVVFECGHALEVQVEWKSSDDSRVDFAEIDAESDGFRLIALFTAKRGGVAVVSAEFADGVTEACSFAAAVLGETVLELPAKLNSVGEEAFLQSPVHAYVLPEGMQSIGARAFAENVSLTVVYMPDSVVSIAADAFEGSTDAAFVCASENAAAEFARFYGIPYIIVP